MTDRLRLHAIALLAAVLWFTCAPAGAPVIGPLRIVLLVDSSSAMASMLNSFRTSLVNFVDAIPGTTDHIEPEMAMISTGGQMRIRVPPTTDRLVLHKAAAAFSSDGGANAFLDSLLEADQRILRAAPERRSVFVIVMTDAGASRGEVRIDAYNTFARAFLTRGGRAHGIIVRDMNAGINSDIVRNITTNTGGYFDTAAIANALPEKMKDIAALVAADIP